VSEAFSGPFYSHTSGYAPAELNYAADCVNAHLDNFGPFDGAIGFSQGAAQLLAYLYQEQIEHTGSSPHSPSLGFWICFSSTAPISRDFECHASLLRGLSPSAVLHGALNPDQSILVETITRSFQSAKLIGVLPKDADVDYFGLKSTENGGDFKTLALDRMPPCPNCMKPASAAPHLPPSCMSNHVINHCHFVAFVDNDEGLLLFVIFFNLSGRRR
jgi:hypothetical protein